MTCEQIDELLAAFCVDALEHDEDAAMRAHLLTCRRHDAALAELSSVAERLPLAAEEREPSAQLRSRLLDAFDAELAAARVTPISSARRPSFAARPRFALLAAAAVLVLAVVGMAVWNVMLQTGGDHEGTMVVHLVGTAGSGELVYVPDEGVAMIKLDLPELPSDRTYQAWRIDNGQKTSLGLVPSTGVVAMDVDLSDGGAVAISEEPAGGSDQPTSTSLIAGGNPVYPESATASVAPAPPPTAPPKNGTAPAPLAEPEPSVGRSAAS